MLDKYVCLEGIEQGNRFFTTNSVNPEKLLTGEVAYKILGYANTSLEAQEILYPSETTEEKRLRIKNYMMKMPLEQLGLTEKHIDDLSNFF